MSLFGLGSRNQKTFRPKKSAPSGSKAAQLQNHIDATLGSGNLREAVRLPPGEHPNEWLAVNTVDFFNQVNILYGTLTEFCTASSCPLMTAGPRYEYRWADGVTIKKPIEVSAPKYVEYLMDWIEAQLDDESIFPQKFGASFPPNFQDVVKTIFKRLFRVYAHIYHTHFEKIVSLKEEAHLNTCFKHFVLFTWSIVVVHRTYPHRRTGDQSQRRPHDDHSSTASASTLRELHRDDHHQFSIDHEPDLEMASSSNDNSNIRLKPRMCNCGRTAAIHIVKTNENGNKGRLFFVCPSKYTENPNCNYFKFVAEDDEDVTSTIRSNTRASDGVTVEDFNELRRRLYDVENEHGDYGRRLRMVENILKAMVYLIVFALLLYFMM